MLSRLLGLGAADVAVPGVNISIRHLLLLRMVGLLILDCRLVGFLVPSTIALFLLVSRLFAPDLNAADFSSVRSLVVASRSIQSSATGGGGLA